MKTPAIIAFLLLLAVLPLQQPAALDKDVELHIKRLDGLIGRLQEENNRLLQDLHQIKRENRQLEADNKKVLETLTRIEDDLIRLTNTDISQLKANQQKIFDKLPTLDWGTQKRDCKNLGAHQQIKNVGSADKNYTLRYLCYDGQTIHLGTEVHQPPAE